jgi:hypothetical protein
MFAKYIWTEDIFVSLNEGSQNISENEVIEIDNDDFRNLMDAYPWLWVSAESPADTWGGGWSVTLWTDMEIPFVNIWATDLAYSSDFIFNDTTKNLRLWWDGFWRSLITGSDAWTTWPFIQITSLWGSGWPSINLNAKVWWRIQTWNDILTWWNTSLLFSTWLHGIQFYVAPFDWFSRTMRTWDAPFAQEHNSPFLLWRVPIEVRLDSNDTSSTDSFSITHGSLATELFKVTEAWVQSMQGRVEIIGTSDTVQNTIRWFTTQTNDLFAIQQSNWVKRVNIDSNYRLWLDIASPLDKIHIGWWWVSLNNNQSFKIANSWATLIDVVKLNTSNVMSLYTWKIEIYSDGKVSIGWNPPNSTLHIWWSISMLRASAAVSVNSWNQTIIWVTNTAAPRTVTLRTVDTVVGRIYTIKDESALAWTNNITVATEWGQTIDWSATYVINTNRWAVSVYSDWSNRHITSQKV